MNSLAQTFAPTAIQPDASETIQRLALTIAELATGNSQLLRARLTSSQETTSQVLIRSGLPELPDPRLVREIIRQRRKRGKYFGGDLFAEPAWEMLLDLTAASGEHRRVSVTSLCIASGRPSTTALRWIDLLIKNGLVERVPDRVDRRRAYIQLTQRGMRAMAEFFGDVRSEPALIV